ncbi:ABC transporter permease [Mycolicibacterium smegmatis]|nr:ABC transporter permease [Mycolicibacterium smegmatis]MBE9619870.1 ABC transporter permease [Mycolicibacterium smegmatis]MBE9626281.1 ABC transporter permease [Mycolicibacterium smegmatis]MBE9632777.1 ABC transporter permease [Mycolicibacterium smegmatis]MBE9644861.1 ABC transporter permease [Mycolicibacterium smegmatis]MBE9651237.1 ABC transporter permease [Mycolicibacterium smegmatis]
MREALRTVAWTLASLAIFVTVWWILSMTLFNPALVPPPQQVAARAWELVSTGRIWPDVLASLRRVYVGLIAGSVVGVVMGILIGQVKVIERLLDPVMQLMRNLSPTAMIPISIVWFGIGENSKYFLVFWGVVFFVTVNTIAGVAGTPRTRVRAARCFGASEGVIFFRIVLPSAVPYIAAGVRLGVASAFMTIVPAELLAAQRGVGALLQQSSLQGQTDRMFVALAVISLMGFLSDRLVKYLFENVWGRYTRYQSDL